MIKRHFVSMGFLLILTSACQSKKTNFLKAEAVQLAPPKIEVDSLLFNTSAHIKLVAGNSRSIIRYTLDGSMVDSTSTDYTSPITVATTTQLKVGVFHPDFKPSEVEERTLRKMVKDISDANISIFPDSHQNYKGNGPKTLIDGQKGEFDFRKGGRWLGFQTDKIKLELEFLETIQMEKVLVGLLRDQGAWIFFPDAIKVETTENTIGSFKLEESGKEANKKMGFVEVPVEKGKYNQITITINALKQIPEWHSGKGTPPWTFVDEILIE